MDFGGSKVAVAVCALDGSWLAAEIVETTPSLGAEPNVARAVEASQRLLDGAAVAAIGACTFGIPNEDGVALSPAIAGWEHLPLRRRLQEDFDVPVAVVTDVKAAAAAEAAHGALAGADPAIYLNLGTGLAIALVCGGDVVFGAHGAAGEIGYNLPRSTRSLAATSAPHAAIAEDIVSGMGLQKALAGSDDGTRAEVNVAIVFEKAATDSRYGAILQEFLDELCFQIVNVAIALDPERIAVGGGLARSWSHIEGPLRRALEAHVPYPPELVLGAYPFDAPLRGAVDLGLELAADTDTAASTGTGAGTARGTRAAPTGGGSGGGTGDTDTQREGTVRQAEGRQHDGQTIGNHQQSLREGSLR